MAKICVITLGNSRGTKFTEKDIIDSEVFLEKLSMAESLSEFEEYFDNFDAFGHFFYNNSLSRQNYKLQLETVINKVLKGEILIEEWEKGVTAIGLAEKAKEVVEEIKKTQKKLNSRDIYEAKNIEKKKLQEATIKQVLKYLKEKKLLKEYEEEDYDEQEFDEELFDIFSNEITNKILVNKILNRKQTKTRKYTDLLYEIFEELFSTYSQVGQDISSSDYNKAYRILIKKIKK